MLHNTAVSCETFNYHMSYSHFFSQKIEGERKLKKREAFSTLPRTQIPCWRSKRSGYEVTRKETRRAMCLLVGAYFIVFLRNRYNRVKWVDLVQVLYLPLKTEKKKQLNLCGKSHTTSTIYFNLNMEIKIQIPFCWFEIKKSVHSVWKDISIRQTSLKNNDI